MITPEDIDKIMGEDGERIIATGSIEAWLKDNGISDEAFVHACARLAEAMRNGMTEEFVKLTPEEEEDEDVMHERITVAVAAGMGCAFIAGWSCCQALSAPVKLDVWPIDDEVALGVLDTVAARRDEDTLFVYQKARMLEREAFYRILDDKDGWIEDYFLTLRSGADPSVANYDRDIGPAIDRIEDVLYA